MTDRPHRLVLNVRHWSEREADIRERLERKLLKLRRRSRASPPDLNPPREDEQRRTLEELLRGLDDGQSAPELSHHDHQRLRRRAARIAAARSAASGLSHLRDSDRKLIELRLPGVRLGGPRSEHAADVLVAEMLDEMPWFSDALRHVWRGAQGSASAGLGLGFSPLLLSGPPAVGKSHFARRLAELAEVPFVALDLGSGSEGFRVAGVSRGWSNSTPGRPLEAILASGVGNPLILIDELDKGGVHRGESGATTSAWNALLGLLEPSTARAWECPCYRVKFDMSRVCWVLAANEIRHIPAPLLSRCKMVPVKQPARHDLIGVAFREGAKRGIDKDSLELLAEQIMRSQHGEITLRHLMRALDGLQVTDDGRLLH